MGRPAWASINRRSSRFAVLPSPTATMKFSVISDMAAGAPSVATRGASRPWASAMGTAPPPSECPTTAAGGPNSACAASKACATVIDMTVGEGPKSVKDMTGASVVFVARREAADANPRLMEAMYAAFRDAAAWFNDPANFEELVKIYTPLISFGDMPGADQLRRDWIKSVIPAYSTDLKVDRAAVKAIIDFYVENKMLEKPVDPAKLVWSKAP